MGVPGSGKRAMETRVTNLMLTGMTRDEARAEVRRRQQEIGRAGGKISRGGGYAHPSSDPVASGRLGGLASKRKAKNGQA